MARYNERWSWTQEMDESLREAYRLRPKKMVSGLMKRWKLPKHAVIDRARSLGLCQGREPRWTPSETRLIESLGYLSVRTLQKRLMEETGVTRSLGAIAMKRKRMRLRGDFGRYSWLQVAEALAVSPHTVARWARQGKLRSEVRNPEARAEEQRHWVSEEDLRDFIMEHPEELHLGGVDAAWFTSLLSGGKGAGAGAIRMIDSNGPPERRMATVASLKSEGMIEGLARQIGDALAGRVPPYVWTEMMEHILETGTLPPRPRRQVADEDQSEEAASVRAAESLHRLREPLSKLGRERLQRTLSLVRLRLGGIRPESLLQAA